MGESWVMGVLDEIKAILSPAGAWLWAELGNRNPHSTIGRLAALFVNRLEQIRALNHCFSKS